MYYVYILASRRHGTLYIGVTNSLRQRMEQHRAGQGSEFVKTYGIFRLVYVESCERIDEAIAREKQLKRWKRDWKIEPIERDNLDWSNFKQPDGLVVERNVPTRRPCERRDPYGAVSRRTMCFDDFC